MMGQSASGGGASDSDADADTDTDTDVDADTDTDTGGTDLIGITYNDATQHNEVRTRWIRFRGRQRYLITSILTLDTGTRP